jgi:hypothetical protein
MKSGGTGLAPPMGEPGFAERRLMEINEHLVMVSDEGVRSIEAGRPALRAAGRLED